jgi:hypothetical protein
MPPARKSARSSTRSRATFKEPAALKRLRTSLDSADKALAELRKHAGRTAAPSTKGLHKGVSTFVSSARRDAGKFGKALARDFQEAQKQVAKVAKPSSPRSRASATARPKKRSSTTAKRTARKAS